MRPESDDVDSALRPFGVSRETKERLVRFVDLLRRWQQVHNLVSDDSLQHVWRRHIADSAQLAVRFTAGKRWLDLGSGAGFPGLVTAAILAGDPAARVHLVEANQRKAAFLNLVAIELELPVTVHAERIESVVKRWDEPIDWISVRGLAPIAQLCEWLEPLVRPGTKALLLKGANFGVELAEAEVRWEFDLIRYPSVVDSTGSIVEIQRLHRRKR